MSSKPDQTVLLVDDIPDEADLYSEYLDRHSGIAPMTALSAEEALDTLRKSDVDCLVSDNVHTSDGEPLVEVAKRDYPDLPVVLFSGRSRSELSTGVVDGYLQKGSGPDTATTIENLGRVIQGLIAQGGRSAGPTDRSPSGEWTRLGTFDWAESRSVSTTIIEALADRVGFDPTESPPLFDTLDPDGLDSLVTRAATSDAGSDVLVRFPVAGHDVRVFSDGTVEYRADDRPGAEGRGT